MNVSHVRMIVNADDFGYFDEVSRGILDAAARGVVTATGVMANGPALERWLDRLKATPALSIGVHLNATLGSPLTQSMRRCLVDSNGEFQAKSAFAAAVLRGQIPIPVTIAEWRAQIERCLQLGLTLTFLNSHEHVHMLPSLYRAVCALAAEFGIKHVRAPQPEWGPKLSIAGILRNAVFVAARVLTSHRRREPVLIGVSSSGKLDSAYCEWRLQRLKVGVTYELMCHPGWSDNVARRNPKFADYHDWEGELRTLTGQRFAELLHRHRIELVSYVGLQL
jgi:predicted glycoside hydrolase/deacetylase ChbG (UPF0249 family)